MRALAIALLMAFLAVAAVALIAGWLVSTSGGLRAAFAIARVVVPTLSASDLDGALNDEVRIGHLRLETHDLTVDIERLAARIDLRALLQHRVELRSLSASRVQVDWPSSEAEPTPPTDFGLPFRLRVDSGGIDELRIGARGSDPTVFQRVVLVGNMDSESIIVDHGAFSIGPTRFDAVSGRLGTKPPFTLEARADLSSALDQHPLVGRGTLKGTLPAFELAVDADSQESRAHVEASMTPFRRVSFTRLKLAVENFDPALWFADTPTMRLTATADLLPVALAGAANDGRLRVSGPFAIDNALPGALDRQRVPVRSARGVLTWSDDALQLTLEQVLGIRGSANGRMTWSKSAGLDARLRVSGVDASTLHSQLVSTEIAGDFNAVLVDSQQNFTGSLRNARGLPLVADFDLGLRERLLTLRTARLQLGDGRADVQGQVELRGGYATRLSGTVAAFDVAKLVPGVDTRINGRFEVDGRLAEPRSGRATLELSDSRLYGRALTGRAAVTLADRRVDVDLDLASGAARLTALGGIGAGRELTYDLNVPDLAALFPKTGGRVVARGTIAGDLTEPRVQLTLTGSELKLPNGHSLAQLDLTLAGGTAPNEPMALMAKMSGYLSGGRSDFTLGSATLIARGVTSGHTIELNGTTLTNESIRAQASGGWKDSAWRGALVTAEAGAPFNLLVRSEVPLVVGLSQLAVGPGDFELAGTRYLAVDLQRKDGRWQTSGRFEEMQPQALDSQARAPRRVVRTNAGDRIPLTLAGRWSLEYTDSVTGIAVIERTGGDLYSGVDGLNPIGVSDIGAALNIVANRITGNAYLRGRALGKVDAQIDAYFNPALTEGRPLAQDKPFKIAIDASLPDLSWIGPLIGDSVQFAGRAEVRAAIGGTPADPTSQGTLSGDALRLAWVDQAVRLDDGRLEAELVDGVLVLTDLSFTGTPRAEPSDRRALANISAARPHEVRATGRIALATLTGSIGVRAQQLPVLQSRERWMTVSGEGGITLTPKRADLYGKLTVDGAYINFASLRSTRALPSDVVVVRAERPGSREAAAPPLEVFVDVRGATGERFYLAGTGLETRLAGDVHLTGRPSQLRLTGSLRAVDGVFNGYGQRLQINRGIVTFQGPIDDPALNVLALRTGLPVEVGVDIGGTVQRPIIRLHSNPSMSDAERLNWLVLGRPPSANDGQDRALLSAAASALFSSQGDSAGANVLRSLGIDDITVRPGSDGASMMPRETVAGRLRSAGTSASATDFVAIGKRLNEDLYLSFEQALTGAEYFIALNYRLTERLSLITRAGSTNALDLVYSFSFD